MTRILWWLWSGVWAAGKTLILVLGFLLCVAGLGLYRAAEAGRTRQ